MPAALTQIMTRKILTILLFISSFNLFSQHFIVGEISNEKKIPIADAKVQIEGTNTLTYTNSEGYFELVTTASQITLSVQHLLYESLLINYSKLADSTTINLTLTEKKQTLNTVEVNSKKVVPVYTVKNATILDYVLLPNQILALNKINQNYQLLALSFKGNEIRKRPLHFTPITIRTDCFGGMHIIGKDSCYQITPNWSLIAYTHEMFQTHYAPCAATTRTNIIIHKRHDYNQMLTYYIRQKDNKRLREMVSVGDEIIVQVANDYQVQLDNDPAPNTVHSSIANHEAAKEKMQNAFWLAIQLSKDAYHPLIKLRDSLYIFDHGINKCLVYDEFGHLRREFSISHSTLPGWKFQLITDKALERIYALTIEGGNTKLHEISLTNGAVLNSYALEEHAFPKNLQIRNGYVYYRYTSKSGYYKLFRQRLVL